MAEVQLPTDPGMSGAPATNPTMMQKIAEIVDKLAPQLVQGMTPKYGTTVTGSADAATPGMIGAPISGGQPPTSAIPTTPGGTAISPVPLSMGKGNAAAEILSQHRLTPNPSVPIPTPHSSGFSFPDSKTAHAATAHDAITNIIGVVNAVKQRQEQKLERRAMIVFNSLHDALGRGDNETIGRMLDPETAEGKANMKILEKSGIGVPPEIDMKKQKPATPEEKGMQKAVTAIQEKAKPGIGAQADPAQVAAQKAALEKEQAESKRLNAEAGYYTAKGAEGDHVARYLELSRKDPKDLSPEDGRELAALEKLHNVLATSKTLTPGQQAVADWTQRQIGPDAKIDPKSGKPYPPDEIGRTEWETGLKASTKTPSYNTAYANAKLRDMTGDPNANINTATGDQLDAINKQRDKLRFDVAQPYMLARAEAMAKIQTGEYGRKEQIQEQQKYKTQISQLKVAQVAIDTYVKQIDAGQHPDATSLTIKLGPVAEAFKTNPGILGSISGFFGGNTIDRNKAIGAKAALDEVIGVVQKSSDDIGALDVPKKSGPQEFDFDPKTGTLIPHKAK